MVKLSIVVAYRTHNRNDQNSSKTEYLKQHLHKRMREENMRPLKIYGKHLCVKLKYRKDKRESTIFEINGNRKMWEGNSRDIIKG